MVGDAQDTGEAVPQRRVVEEDAQIVRGVGFEHLDRLGGEEKDDLGVEALELGADILVRLVRARHADEVDGAF